MAVDKRFLFQAAELLRRCRANFSELSASADQRGGDPKKSTFANHVEMLLEDAESNLGGDADGCSATAKMARLIDSKYFSPDRLTPFLDWYDIYQWHMDLKTIALTFDSMATSI